MAWETIASGNSIEEFQNANPTIDHLSAGDRGRIVVSGLPLGTAHALFDIIGAEQTVGWYLAPAGASVIDCHEENGIGYVEFEVTGTPVVPLLIAAAAALLALGVFGILIVIAMQIERLDPQLFTWQVIIAIVAVVIVIGVVTVLVAKRGRMAAGPIKVGG